jgi:hypothetical protein
MCGGVRCPPTPATFSTFLHRCACRAGDDLDHAKHDQPDAATNASVTIESNG